MSTGVTKSVSLSRTRCNVADRAYRCSAELACALGDCVDSRKDLIGLFVQEEVVVRKVQAGNVPVEIFVFTYNPNMSASRI